MENVIERKPKLSRTVEYAHYVKLPKNTARTDSIYKWYDIVYQEAVIVRSTHTRYKYSEEKAPSILRSAKKFTVKINVNGKVKYLDSKYEW